MHVFLSQVLELTKEWTNKWNETQNILKVCQTSVFSLSPGSQSQALSVCFGVCVEQEETLALRKEGIGVILDSELPHLIGIDDDLLSTGIILYHLKVMNIRQCSSQYERWRERCLYSWMNSFIFYYVVHVALDWFVCVCRREGHMLAVMMPLMNKTSVSLLTELSLSPSVQLWFDWQRTW